MEKRVNPWAGAVRVLWEPQRVIQSQVERPSIWPIYIILMIGLALVTVLQVMFNKEMVLALAAQGVQSQGQELNLEAMLPFLIITSVVSAVIMTWLTGLFQGFVLWVSGNFAGVVQKFRLYFILAGYAAVPGLVGTFLKFAIDPTGLAGIQFGPALFIEASSKFMSVLLASLDLFSVWGLVISVIGFAALHRTKAQKVWWVGVVIWGLQVGLAMLVPGMPQV